MKTISEQDYKIWRMWVQTLLEHIALLKDAPIVDGPLPIKLKVKRNPRTTYLIVIDSLSSSVTHGFN